MSFALTLWISLSLGAPPGSPLAQARRHLEAGKLDEILFTLQGKSFSEPEVAEAVDLLGRAGHTSLRQNDPMLALQFAQMALQHAPGDTRALEIAARACFTQLQYTPAVEYADRWLKASQRSPPALLLRAEIAVSEGDWAPGLALLDELPMEKLAAKERARAKELHKRARGKVDEHEQSVRATRELEERMAQATVQAKKMDVFEAARARAAAGALKVIVYGTNWNASCKDLMEWLKGKRLPFVYKNVEQDEEARTEMSRKLVNARLEPDVIPVTDINGRLVQEFKVHELENLIREATERSRSKVGSPGGKSRSR